MCAVEEISVAETFEQLVLGKRGPGKIAVKVNCKFRIEMSWV